MKISRTIQIILTFDYLVGAQNKLFEFPIQGDFAKAKACTQWTIIILDKKFISIQVRMYDSSSNMNSIRPMPNRIKQKEAAGHP